MTLRTCDYAACSRLAKHHADGFDYCGDHAERDAFDRVGSGTDAAAGRGKLPASVAPATTTLRPAPAATRARTLGELLEHATGPTVGPNVRRMAERLERELEALRQAVVDDEKAAAARAEVARLEKQLADAKARARTLAPRGRRGPDTRTDERKAADAARAAKARAGKAARREAS